MKVLRKSFQFSCCGQCYGARVRCDDHHILISQDHVSLAATCMYVRTHVLHKAKVNNVNLPDCVRTRKYSVAFAVGFDAHHYTASLIKHPQVVDNLPIHFSSEENVLTEGWHTWSIGAGDARTISLETTILTQT